MSPLTKCWSQRYSQHGPLPSPRVTTVAFLTQRRACTPNPSPSHQREGCGCLWLPVAKVLHQCCSFLTGCAPAPTLPPLLLANSTPFISPHPSHDGTPSVLLSFLLCAVKTSFHICIARENWERCAPGTALSRTRTDGCCQ